MKKGSESEFQQNKAQKNKKTDILDLNKYRTKKLSAQNNSTQKIESEEKQKSTPAFEGKMIRMDLHKKRYKAHYEENIKFHEEETTKNFDSKKKETQVIILDDYRKRKWKKNIFLNTAQVAGMSFLFLFMLMNLSPSFKKGADQKIAKADWFDAPANKGIVIRGLTSSKENRSLASDKPCAPKGEDPIKGMKKINPKNCIVDKL